MCISLHSNVNKNDAHCYEIYSNHWCCKRECVLKLLDLYDVQCLKYVEANKYLYCCCWSRIQSGHKKIIWITFVWWFVIPMAHMMWSHWTSGCIIIHVCIICNGRETRTMSKLDDRILAIFICTWHINYDFVFGF